MAIKTERLLTVPSWDEERAEIARAYWTAHGFTVTMGEGPILEGRRGSGRGTWFPYFFGREGHGFFEVDWRRPEGVLTMTPGSGSTVLVGLDMDFMGTLTLMGRESQWAGGFLRLEVAELHHLLWDAGDLSDVWRRFWETERPATAMWIWTKGRAFKKLPDEWEDEICELEFRFLKGGEDVLPPIQQ